ncbi:MAG: hypothetical protein ACE367_11525 [Acidimicrobiales bacterium]
MRLFAGGLFTTLAIAACGSSASLPGVVASWDYDIVYEAPNPERFDGFEKARIASPDESTLTVMWFPRGCPADIDIELEGTAERLTIKVEQAATDECAAVDHESTLTLRLEQPVATDAVRVEFVP